VIWVSAEPEKVLIDLRKKIDKALPEFKADHHFKSHITFARVKYPANDSDRKKIIDVLKKPVAKKEFSVEKLVLYKSTLTPKGPVYDIIETFLYDPNKK
jgi:RNA 2',3'-cyclic 3'-phosphodiesterase